MKRILNTGFITMLCIMAGCTSESTDASPSEVDAPVVEKVVEQQPSVETSVVSDAPKPDESQKLQPKSKRYQEGVHFEKLKNVPEYAKSDTVEVLEFFSYGCPHCYRLEPTLKKWTKDKPKVISFKKVPAQWNPYYKNLAKAYYLIELLSLDHSVHENLFAAIHERNNRLRTVSAIKDFFITQGVSEQQFDTTFDSFGMSGKLKMGDALFSDYKLKHVPVFVIGGRYVTDVTRSGGADKVTDVIEYLTRQIRQQSK